MHKKLPEAKPHTKSASTIFFLINCFFFGGGGGGGPEWNESRKLGLNVRKVEVIYILYSQLFLSHLEESDTLIKKRQNVREYSA